MREPRKRKVAKSRKYPRGEKYEGAVQHQGRQRWVGTFPTRRQWMTKARAVLDELSEEDDRQPPATARTGATVGEFARVRVIGDRVLPLEGLGPRDIWPWTHPRRIKKESSFRAGAEALRPFIRKYGHRRFDSFTRAEARQIAATFSSQTRAAVRRLFGDALDDEVISGRNVFGGLGYPSPARRNDPDFRIITDEEFDRLCTCALESRAGDYCYTLQAMTLFEGMTGVRPGEIFAVEHASIDLDEERIFLRFQISDRGELVPLKNELKRLVPLFPEIRDAYLHSPRLSKRWAFPTPTGKHFKLSNFHTHWNAIRASAGMPGFNFYDLKHRAITWMVTAPPHGLGLDPPTVAIIVGHQDAGATIAKHYLRLDQRQAIERALQAKTVFDGTARPLHVVRG